MWRRTAKGDVKVLLVHRPRYDDWSLPKGKLDPGETHREAALREVEEETGLVCKALEELRTVEYRDRKGRAKRVRYWAMEPVSGEFTPNNEVDEVRWVALDNLGKVLTYQRDTRLVAQLFQPAGAR